ncbi:hypothetical protein EDB85DRAFT_1903187 [Lactarius pseudohatsudake]|nr:hypothetical protein EDB85DRAFT_1903187 [Lactarius pseudohatsudake]
MRDCSGMMGVAAGCSLVLEERGERFAVHVKAQSARRAAAPARRPPRVDEDGGRDTQEERGSRGHSSTALALRLYRTGMRAKGSSIILTRVIIPPLTSTGCGVTYSEEEGTLPKMRFIIFKFDRKVETIPAPMRSPIVLPWLASTRVSRAPTGPGTGRRAGGRVTNSRCTFAYGERLEAGMVEQVVISERTEELSGAKVF